VRDLGRRSGGSGRWTAGRLDGKRRCGGDGSFLRAMRVARGGCRVFLVLAALRHGQRPDRVLEARLGDRSWPEVPSVVKVFRAKAQCFGANDCDTCGMS
jgi:hypothetical protein